MARKLKVLTLGWEFPPLYAGGLGPACYGLTKALSNYVDNTIILPRSDKKFKIKNVTIIGLNHLVSGKLNAKSRKVNSIMTEEINWNEEIFSAYPLTLPRKANHQWVNSGLQRFIGSEEKQNLFSEKDIYGTNIMRKVAAYTDMVCELAEKIDFDIIHAHDWITYNAAVQLKHYTLRPLVVHVHSLETDRVHTQSRNSVYEIERVGMIQADRVLPVSNFTKQCIVQHYGIDEKKISPVYNGYDADFNLKNRKTKFGNGKTEKKVLFLGRITAQKGPEYLVETVRKLLTKMDNVKVLIAGKGDMRPHLEYLVEKNNLKDKVVFTGFLNKDGVKILLRETDAYIMPSVSEPFGLSAVEAAQYNIPCVISKQSGAAEVMPNTLQADYWDTDRMANYLFASLNYKSLSDTLTEKTQVNLKDINWDVAASSVLKNYRFLLN
jgi:glycosyltransferase involved in cell wall biosynthesis